MGEIELEEEPWTPHIGMQMAFGNDIPAMVPGMEAVQVNLHKLLRKFTKETFPEVHELNQEELNGFPTSQPELKMKYGGGV